MVPLRNKSVSVRLEEETYLRLRRHSLQSGVPTSALVRTLVHRWLQEQGDQEGEAVAEREGAERRWQPGLFDEGGAP
jgi:predicted DNA-binding protein